MRLPRAGERPLPKHPYRDSALLNAVLAALVVVVAYLTGGNLARALIIAAVVFIFATAWSWWRFRERREEQGRR